MLLILPIGHGVCMSNVFYASLRIHIRPDMRAQVQIAYAMPPQEVVMA